MIEFSIWDIFRNLLLAGRWTVTLSLTAFIGGGLVGLLLLVGRLWATRAAVPGAQKAALVVSRLLDGYIVLFQGTPLLMQLFAKIHG